MKLSIYYQTIIMLIVLILLCITTSAFAEVRYTITDIGTLSGGYTRALDINNVSQVVGESGSYAFLWEDGVMINLGN